MLGVVITCFTTLLVISWLGWGIHATMQRDTISTLERARKTLQGQLDSADAQKSRVERVPLRTKCRCKHDAYEHDERGCQNWLPVLGYCSCLATQEQVMFEPDPIRKMLLL